MKEVQEEVIGKDEILNPSLNQPLNRPHLRNGKDEISNSSLNQSLNDCARNTNDTEKLRGLVA